MKRVAGICFGALLLCLTACSTQDVRNFLDKLTARPAQSSESVEPPPPPPPPPAKPVKTGHAKKSDPKPDLTDEELVEYLRGKLLVDSPSDGFNDNLEVAYEPSTSVLTVTRPGGRCDHFLNALDTNSMVWDIFDPGDTHNSREGLLRLTVTSTRGKTARTCYDKENHLDENASSNRARFLFSSSKAEQSPGFQDNMTKALKKLIVISGGAPEKKIF
ncbi:MAG: hypothetical protein ABSE51_08745 [Terracidiphilus sp.]